MVNQDPSNQVLLEKLNGIRELMIVKFDQNDKDHEEVAKHLGALEEQVEKNTKLRTILTSYKTTVALVISTIISLYFSLK